MKKYQFVETYANTRNAGSKAPQDIEFIANKLEFEPLKIILGKEKGSFSKISNQLSFITQWEKAYNAISSNSIVLLQYPKYGRQINRLHCLKKLKERKNVHFVSVIHDVNELRNIDQKKSLRNEFEFVIKNSDYVILHNKSMIDYFVKRGIDPKKLVNLQIFDYLRNNYMSDFPVFSTTINIAGNLDTNKSEYLKYLDKVDNNFQLFGPNFSLNSYSNVIYGGSFKPSEIPNVLNSGYGLIWDGTSIHSCEGSFGNYLKYNNPHKLSLYLASNLPVIIWSKAAEANFVKENGIGLLIDDLSKLPNILSQISKEEYLTMCSNVQKIAKNLSNGFYMTSALNTVITKIETNLNDE